MPTVTITGFNGLIARVLPHAYRDDTLPSINGVHVESDGRHLFAVATDRYSVGIIRRELGDDSDREPWSALLTPADLRAVKAVTPPRHQNKPTTLVWDAARHALTVHVGEHALTLPDRREHDAKFPAWRRIIADVLAESIPDAGDLHLNPEYLARFTKGLHPGDYQPITVCATPLRRPVVIAHGDDFLGLLMPVRTSDAGPAAGRQHVLARWADVLAAKPTPALAA